jgi:hypothetical protein
MRELAEGEGDRRGTGSGYGLSDPSRGGQITPSQPGPPRSPHMPPPQIGQTGIPPAGAVAIALAADTPAAGAGAATVATRAGQITPSHSRSLHLKSGALGFRLPSRLSHIGP